MKKLSERPEAGIDCEGGISGCPVFLLSERPIRFFGATGLFVNGAYGEHFRASHGAVARGFQRFHSAPLSNECLKDI